MRQNPRQPRPPRRTRRLRVEALEQRLALAGDITTGLIHYWTFDETVGDIAHDVAGGSDGTLVNWTPTEPKWESGRVGGALRFDSADNYVIAPNPGMSGSFAISFWLNASSRNGAFARIVTPKAGNVVFLANELGRGLSYTQNDDSFTYSSEPPTFQLLDTRTLESFSGGQYLAWRLQGHIKIRFSNLANGLNTVLSGIFFD